MIRARARFAVAAVVTIIAGLGLHLHGRSLGAARDVIGDALWASMIVWWTGAVAPRARLSTRLLAALIVCFAVELSQLYHAPWLDAIRHRTLGHLLLGSGFEPRDFAAYPVGVMVAGLVERALRRQR